MGPLTLDATALVSMRLNEHTLHTWDIEVASEPEATLPDDEVAVVVDNLELVGRFTACPDGGERSSGSSTDASTPTTPPQPREMVTS